MSTWQPLQKTKMDLHCLGTGMVGTTWKLTVIKNLLDGSVIVNLLCSFSLTGTTSREYLDEQARFAEEVNNSVQRVQHFCCPVQKLASPWSSIQRE